MGETERLQLLRRPQQLLNVDSEIPGLHSYWKAKLGLFKRKSDVLPRVSVNAACSVIFSNLHINGKCQIGSVVIPLIQICYIESESNDLLVRGISFRLTLKGVKNVADVCEALRFLVVRQRIPHRILKLPFEWEGSLPDVVTLVKNQSLVTCFDFSSVKALFVRQQKLLLNFNTTLKTCLR